MKTLLATCLVLLALASGTAAQTVSECDWRASARNLVEPWEETSRTFANGAVRLALLDSAEPASAAMHLLVISPPYGETGEAQCRVISFEQSLGFAALYLQNLSASYDASVGLTFALPGMIYLPENGFSNSVVLRFTLNQATGEINAWKDLGNE
jgi:hypothetical protein